MQCYVLSACVTQQCHVVLSLCCNKPSCLRPLHQGTAPSSTPQHAHLDVRVEPQHLAGVLCVAQVVVAAEDDHAAGGHILRPQVELCPVEVAAEGGGDVQLAAGKVQDGVTQEHQGPAGTVSMVQGRSMAGTVSMVSALWGGHMTYQQRHIPPDGHQLTEQQDCLLAKLKNYNAYSCNGDAVVHPIPGFLALSAEL